MFKGYDISGIQGNVDFNKLAQNGITFVILRGYVGNDFFDSTFAKNLANAKAAGLKAAVYNFCYILKTDNVHTHRDPVSQAQLHFNACGSNVVACADIEWPLPKDWKTWGIDAAFVTQWTLAYLAEYERLSGRKPIIYSYPDFIKQSNFANTPALAQYPLWIADYKSTAHDYAPWTSHVLWQSGQEKMVGHSVTVDVDYCDDLSIFDIPVLEAPINIPASPLQKINPELTLPDSIQNPPIVPVTPPTQSTLVKVVTGLYGALFNYLKKK